MKIQYTWFAAGLAVMGVAMLFTRGGFEAALPLLVLLACPLMMIVMMRGMGGARGTDSRHEGGSQPGSTERHDSQRR